MPRIFRPMAAKLKWGILGTGNIARQFCQSVRHCRRGILAAVGSRTAAHARQFARIFGIAADYGSYRQLIADPSVDAVYVALPNSLHCHWTIAALRAGKHVLCEKPLALDARQATGMFAAAKRARRLLCEAFMYRSHPITRAVLKAVRSGAIGELRLIRTSFCFRTRRVRGNVRFVRDLGGGALMDIGCYCVNFARLLAGNEPTAIHATAKMHPGGVDELVAADLVFPGGLISQFVCSLGAQANNTAYLCGTEGYIEIPVPWKPRRRAKFILTQGIVPKMDQAKPTAAPPRDVRYATADRELFALEADDFAAAVFGNRPAPISPADSLGNMRVLDEIRRQIGLEFD